MQTWRLLTLFLCLFVGMATATEQMPILKARPGWTFKIRPQRHYTHGLLKKNLLDKHITSGKTFNVTLPDSFDLRHKGLGLSPALDQGECGSCYAHAAVSQVWDAFLQSGQLVPLLSPQYLMDCDSSAGCGGGYFDVLDAAIEPRGVPMLAEYPYNAVTQKCKSSKPVASITAWHFINEGGPSTKDIEEALVGSGFPILITVYADRAMEYYSSGIFNACTNWITNHMVDIVGYNNEGNEFDADGFLPPGKGYWVIRNSWGNDYGLGGFLFMRMTDGKGRLCSRVAEEAVYIDIAKPLPTPTPQPPDGPQPFLSSIPWWIFGVVLVSMAAFGIMWL